MKLIVVAADIPYPANHGGRVDVWERLKLLSSLGHEITLVVTSSEPVRADNLAVINSFIDTFIQIPRQKRIADLFSLLPFQATSRHALRTYDFHNRSYDVLLLEGSYCAPILDNPTLKVPRIIQRIHNDEPTYFRNMAKASSFPQSLYYVTEAMKFRRFERTVAARCEQLWYISAKEFQKARGLHPRSIFLPPVVDLPATPRHASPSGRVLYVGSLFMPNNRDGLEWYMGFVHPHLRHRPDYKLVIAGNSRGQPLTWLTDGPFGADVEVHDSPANLAPLYEDASIFINPIRYGAGVKIKTLDGIKNGLPIVTTSTGNEGTGLIHGAHLFEADQPTQFARCVADILDHPETGQLLVDNARAHILREYDCRAKITEALAI